MGWSWRRRRSPGPRGTYVHVGAGGFRYARGPDPRPHDEPRSRVVEAVEPGRLATSGPDELIEEIRRKTSMTDLVTIVCGIGCSFLLIGLFSLAADGDLGPADRIFLASGTATLLTLPWAAWWDRQNSRVRIHYDFDESGATVHEAVVRFIAMIGDVENAWSIRIEDDHGDWKRNAGAGVSVHRSPVRVGWGPPTRVETNTRVGHLVVGQTTLYFFPDRLIVRGPGGVRGISYGDLAVEADTVDFIEEEWVPRDAENVGTTWKFVNRDGGPDLRFLGNRQLPILRYSVLNLSAPTGLRLKLHLSAMGPGIVANAYFDLIKLGIENLQWRRTPLGGRSVPSPDWRDELPPLVAPTLKVARIGASALEYRWLGGLPEWLVPMVWGVVFALPAVAVIVLMGIGQDVGTWTFLGISLLASGCGIPVLARDGRLRMAANESRRRMDLFREAMREDFRTKPAGRVDVEGLEAECQVDRDEADSVMDEFYRRMVELAVADGVITPDERRRLRILANAFRMAPDRRDRPEREGASARYRRALDEALADGVVTPEESRGLEEMRANLGVEEADGAAHGPEPEAP